MHGLTLSTFGTLVGESRNTWGVVKTPAECYCACQDLPKCFLFMFKAAEGGRDARCFLKGLGSFPQHIITSNVTSGMMHRAYGEQPSSASAAMCSKSGLGEALTGLSRGYRKKFAAELGLRPGIAAMVSGVAMRYGTLSKASRATKGRVKEPADCYCACTFSAQCHMFMFKYVKGEARCFLKMISAVPYAVDEDTERRGGNITSGMVARSWGRSEPPALQEICSRPHLLSLKSEASYVANL